MSILVGNPSDRPSPAVAGRPGPPPVPEVAIPPEAAETADELFRRLRRLYAEGRIAIDLDNKRLTHIDSPVSFEAWGNQWVYPLLALTCALWGWFGWKAGAGAAGAGRRLPPTPRKT